MQVQLAWQPSSRKWTRKPRKVMLSPMQVALLQQPNSQTELEALAVVWACEHLHLYIYGKPVTVYTDHKPLASIYGNPSSKPPARIEKWALRLHPYRMTFKYRRGEVNPADYLTCHPAKHGAETSRSRKSQRSTSATS